MQVSIRRTISLIITSCLSCLLLLDTIIEFDITMENKLESTRSDGGLMLNRSQMLLSKEILLQPSLFSCLSKTQNSSVKYPVFIIVKTRVVSSENDFQRRMFTRISWAREARLLGIPVIYAIERASDQQIQKKLEYESRIYNDILEFYHIDAYYNISIKTTRILHWFIQYGCFKTSSYLFLVDDDILINIPLLIKMISNNTFQLDTIYGSYSKDIGPSRIGKRTVRLNDYPNQIYAEFITSTSTLYPSLILQELFSMINQNQSIIFLDDIITEKLGIKRAPLFAIEDCSYTDLLSRTIINKCNHNRRVYIWSKYILSRLGQNTFEIDRLIQTTTTTTTAYIKWYDDFKQTRNSTAIIFFNIIEKSYLKIFFFLIFVIICIFLLKIISFRQSSFKSFTLDK